MLSRLAALALTALVTAPLATRGAVTPMRQAPDPSHAAIDSIFARYDHTSTPGCALGVFRDDRIVYARGYGMADLNQRVPIGANTVFYIASTSKQFTAMSVALLAEDGKLSLDDPIRKWIPELPAYADRITVRHLLHHTSGLRDYLGLWAISGRSVADEVPQEVALDLITRQRALDFEPGSQYSYSNSGYLLLAELVKRASGLSLRDFAAARIFQPLGMTSTQFHDDNTRIVERRAEGYQPDGAGTFAIVRTSFALVGDGGLLTTIEDLLKWDANFYHNVLGRGDPALIRQVTTPSSSPLAGGREQRYAFGLMPGTYRGLAIVEHGGAFIGFRAQLLRVPDAHLSVAILCNDYTAAPEQMARRVVDRYLADRLAPIAGDRAGEGSARLTAAALDRWVGRYEVLPGLVANVVRRDSTLRLTFAGATLPLTARADSLFSAPSLSEPIVFSHAGAIPTMRAEALGMTAAAPRLPPAPVLTTAQRQAYAGRYVSAELDSWAVIRVQGDTLMARMRWGEWLPLEPLAPDTFVAVAARVDFTRDRTGAVSGFRLSQARTRGVVFDRAR
ncbi:MAG: serine hydrolase domain-containing protein [Gemmatimonadota bacterium]